MTFKKMILGVAVLASMASGMVHAAEATSGREMRWDFSCEFERQGPRDCEALATIYTRRDLDGRDHDHGGGHGDDMGTQWSHLNKLAVSCDRGGLIYANGASVKYHHDNLIISAANGGRPRLILELPLGEGHHGGGGHDDSLNDGGGDHNREHRTDARLVLPNGDEIHGQCEYRTRNIR